MIRDKTDLPGSAFLIAGKLLVCLLLTASLRGEPSATRMPPAHLSETGLYSDIATKAIAPANLMFTPQYPLWSDGAAKRRWIFLPPGKEIDASNADNWVFPVGTKLWKEFSFGKRVETRLLEKTAPSDWSYATYAWNADESDAELVSERGARNHVEIAPGVRHDIPGVNDCKACHEGQGRDVVLGFNALQLSPDRDPNALHAEATTAEMIDLGTLMEQGRLDPSPSQFIKNPPRINTPSPRARAAIGYLWANCGGCHNATDPLASVGMVLRFPVEGEAGVEQSKLPTVIGHASKFQIPGLADGESDRICPGDPSRSSIVYRMGTRNPYQQMPPLGTKIVDQQALDLLTAWIKEDLGHRSEVK
jgi:hypothetical protein